MKRDIIIGIDLHGTLLNEKWEIEYEMQKLIIDRLKTLKFYCRIFVCSGNDLSFINQYIPENIRTYFDGYVLETGCCISDGTEEIILIPEKIMQKLMELRKYFENIEFSKIKYFARRLATISIFTKDSENGVYPDILYKKIIKLFRDGDFLDYFYITHSNVAVDIVPRGFNKYTGLRYFSKTSTSIGIADSLNDLDLIINTDYAFIPKNAGAELISALSKRGKDILPFDLFDINKNDIIWQTESSYSKSVSDILQKIDKEIITR